jgi:hypothetical protein
MWCQVPRPAIGAEVASVLRDLERGDAKGDLDAAPIDHSRLHLHLAEALEIADGGLGCCAAWKIDPVAG